MITQLSFFNTTKLNGHDLESATDRAIIQNNRVMGIFEKYRELTPYECWKIYNAQYTEALLTSIRRSITVLTKKGLLEKTDRKKAGGYGSGNYVWKIVK